MSSIEEQLFAFMHYPSMGVPTLSELQERLDRLEAQNKQLEARLEKQEKAMKYMDNRLLRFMYRIIARITNRAIPIHIGDITPCDTRRCPGVNHKNNKLIMKGEDICCDEGATEEQICAWKEEEERLLGHI